MDRKSFVFYIDWAKVLASVDDRLRLSVYDAAVKYVAEDIVPDLEPMAMLAFQFIKQDIDRDLEKWEDTRKKRAEAGKKHKGNQHTRRKEQMEHEQTNGTNVPKLEQMEHEQTNGTNGTVNVNVSHYICDDISSSLHSEDNLKSSEDDLCQRVADNPSTQGSDESEAIKRGKEESKLCEDIRQYYNSKVEENGSQMPTIKNRFGNQRKAWVLARVSEYGLEQVKQAIDKATVSRFLSGDNGKGWKGSFDWIMRPNNFPKVLDGNYDNRPNGYGNGSTNNRQAGRSRDEKYATGLAAMRLIQDEEQRGY